MQTVTAFVKSSSGLRQCPGAAVITLVDALTRGSAPVIVVQTEEGVVSQMSLRDCTHGTFAGLMLHLFDNENALLALLFRTAEQAEEFTNSISKHVKITGQGGLNVGALRDDTVQITDSDGDMEAKIREILLDPTFPGYVDYIEKILCRMINVK